MAAPSVLIVEDDDVMVKAILTKFRAKGFDVKYCSNGNEATDMLKKEKFDWVVLDLLMPIKDGYQVLAEKKDTLNADTKVCVLTCLGQEESLQKAKNLGATLCFVKSQTSLNEVIDALKDN